MTHSHPYCHHEDRYPFANNGHGCNAHCTSACNNTMPPPHKPQTPTGWVKENRFRIIDGYPYLVDMPMLKWGPRVRTSEQIDTKIVPRKEVSCIRLDAVFDCTTSMSTNMTLRNYLKQIIERKYLPLDGVLPIIQEWTSFKLTYHVEDLQNNTVYEDSATVSIKEAFMHLTDVRDLLLTSSKGIFMVDIPDLTQYGSDRYILVLDSLEVFATGFNTIELLEDPSLNPYYAFTENYTNIAISHENVETAEPDYPEMIITEIPLNKEYSFDAGITTRLKLAFTAYLSDLILSGNTFDVWSALTQPTDAIIAQMKTDLDTMNEHIGRLTQTIDEQNVIIETIKQVNEEQNVAIEEIKQTIESYNTTIESCNATIESYNTTINEMNQRIIDQNTTISELNQTVSNQTTTIDELTSQIDEQSDEIDELVTNVTNLTNENSSLTDRITDLEEAVEALKTDEENPTP